VGKLSVLSAGAYRGFSVTHIDVLKLLLAIKKVDIEAPIRGGGGERAIHLPCIWGSGGRGIDAVDAVLKYGANIDSTTADNRSSLRQAARFHGFGDLVRLLIRRGADIEVRTVLKETPCILLPL